MIKTIIFDFGDIFINLDKSATQRELNSLKIEKISEELQQTNLEYEQGHITSDEFLGAYTNRYPAIEKDQFRRSWNAILKDFPEYRLKFIQKLSKEKDYQLILLSNTNEIHIDWIKQEVPFFEDFKNCFDAFYLSHEIHYRKPNRNIYEFVLSKHQLKPEECLFVDDTSANTDAAKELGIHVWNLEPTREDIIDLFTSQKELF
ncbi:putative hydrolase of the HAD superfamily [Gillisia sp. Hel1_33_143]|uniref:HAD family hydrolase n=1 Tax=Gillisia sp. Hel1_33_143 TaxID=1336796 RepID=UPI0008793276|nr:HAD family phosphatase [Gillisia sp. Hel1_33_143]SDS85291.1 putative hydrolase of the HAD superfamily [Gillisia sp. Hel1_33_143]